MEHLNTINIKTLYLTDNGEFGIFRGRDNFPVTECPSFLDVAIGAVCLSGTAVIQIYNNSCRIERGMVITLVPWQLASIREVSDDFVLLYYAASKNMFTDTLSSLWRLTPDFFEYMHLHIASSPEESNILRFEYFCECMIAWSNGAPAAYKKESVMQLLRLHYWAVYTVYRKELDTLKVRYSNKEKLTFDFMHHVIEDHSSGRDVLFYAKKLQVTPKYLTTAVKNVSGQSAREWIVYYTILDIKSLLRQTNMDIKSIIARVNFPDQSSLSRYFRKYTGMTPSQYRKKIHL